MRVLAVDTTTERGSVAVVDGEELLGEVRIASPLPHSGRLLPAIDFLLGALQAPLESIGGYAVALGPGSFTGLRIGISTVQGLALATPRPCLGLSTLDVLGARARGEAAHVAAMLDAWREEVYGAVYDGEGRLVAGPFAERPAAFAARVPEGAVYIGAGSLRYRDVVRARDGHARFSARSPFLAGTLGRLAVARLAAGEGVAPGALLPLYVRDAGVAKPAP